MKFIQQNLVP